MTDALYLPLDLPAPDPDPVVAACPVGEDVQAAAGPDGLATATFDRSGTFRFRLSRVWDPSAGRCVFVMLNPSTADAFNLDPTVTRCMGFARTWGFGALEVVNVFALRSTDPAGLKAVDDPVGPGNDDALLAAARAADLVVAAWGVHATLHGRQAQVVGLFDEAGLALHAVRVTKAGHPGHPLYVPGSATPQPWPAVPLPG